MSTIIVALMSGSGITALFGFLKYRAYLKCVGRIIDDHGLPALKVVDAIACPSKVVLNTARRRSSKAK